MPGQNWLQSKQKGEAYLVTLNCPLGKNSPNFVSEKSLYQNYL